MTRIIFIAFILSVVLSACDKNSETYSDTAVQTVNFSPKIESVAALPQTLYIYVFKDLANFSAQYSGPFSGVSVPLYYHKDYLLAFTSAQASKLGTTLLNSSYVQLKSSTDMLKYVNGVPPYMQDPNTNLFYQYYTIRDVSASTPPVKSDLVLERVEAKATARFMPGADETKAYMYALYSYGTYALNRAVSGTLKPTIGADVTFIASTANEVSVKFIPYNDLTGTPANIAAGRTFVLRVWNNKLSMWTEYQLKLADGMPLSVGNNYVFYPTGSQLVFEPTIVENWGIDIALNSK